MGFLRREKTPEELNKDLVKAQIKETKESIKVKKAQRKYWEKARKG